jgi:hypothetical protein
MKEKIGLLSTRRGDQIAITGLGFQLLFGLFSYSDLAPEIIYPKFTILWFSSAHWEKCMHVKLKRIICFPLEFRI